MLYTRDSFVAVWQSMLMMKLMTGDAVETQETTATSAARERRTPALHGDDTKTFTMSSSYRAGSNLERRAAIKIYRFCKDKCTLIPSLLRYLTMH